MNLLSTEGEAGSSPLTTLQEEGKEGQGTFIFVTWKGEGKKRLMFTLFSLSGREKGDGPSDPLTTRGKKKAGPMRLSRIKGRGGGQNWCVLACAVEKGERRKNRRNCGFLLWEEREAKFPFIGY